jgi:hypothetical protein
MLCYKLQSTEAGQDMMDRMKPRRGFPMVMHIFAQQELGKILCTAPILMLTTVQKERGAYCRPTSRFPVTPDQMNALGRYENG